MFKKLKKHWKRILSIILVATLCMQDASYIVYADENPPEELSCEAQTGKSGIYEYTSFDAGSAGALDVNLYLGTLHLRRTDLDIGGERMPVAIEFYFDPVNVTVGNPYGAGWNSVYAQVITYDTLTGTYSYKDENGTWISFKNSEEVNEAGAAIWVEDNEYGVGETGRELYIPASAVNTDYTSVDMVYGEDHYAFDASGHLVRISNGTNQISIAYEPTMGYRIDYVTDSVGRKYDFVYTGQYLTQIMALTASGSTISGTTINYTITDGKLMSVAYSTANVVNYTYDANGNMASLANIDGCGYGIIYVSGTNEVTTVVQKAGMGTTQEAEGTATTIVRTEENKATVTAETSREVYTFDNCGRVENYELQAITSLAEGQSIASASFDCVYGYNMSYGYITNEDGTITNGVVDVETYDEDGVIDEDEEMTEDTEEESTEEATEDTDTYETTTDEYGNVLTETHTVDGLKQTTQYTYSSDGNYLSSVTDENGNTVSYTYNSSSGLLTALKDGNGKTTTYTYNALRELASIKLAVSDLQTSGTSTTNPTLTSDGKYMQANYTYTKGRLTKLVSGDSTYVFTYDIWGNVLKVTMNSKALATYEYGDYASKGQVQTLTYGNGQKVFYTYDALGQVSTVGYTGQLNRFKYSYAPDGTVSNIYDSVLNQTVAYDEDGYIIRKGASASTGTILYAYSAGEDGGYGETVYGRVMNHIVENGDDATTLTVKDGSGNEIFGAVSKTDGFGRVERKTVFTDNLSIRQDFGYITNGENTGNLVTDYDVSYLKGTQKNYLEYGYTYDGNGNITKEELKRTIASAGVDEYDTTGEAIISTSNESTAYTYDQAGQLKTAYNSRTGIKYYYTYDANGNIVCREEYSVASDNTETLIEKITYVYSGTVLMLSQSSVDGYVRYTNDNMGNPIKIQKGTTTYNLTWGEGRMLKGISKDTSNNVTYSYNVDGLRIQKVVKENGVFTVTEYVWGNNGLAGMQTELGTVVVLYDAEGQPIGFSLNNEVYHYVKNLQGDVVCILDENGNTVVEYSYDPWGVPTVTGDTELAKINPCSYRGYDYDEETGYYYLQTRYYDPEIGRFISVDAPETLVLSNNILASNLYGYCYNNSVNYKDPLGFIAANVIGAVIGLVIGIVGGVFLGNWLADKLKLTGWKRNVFVAGIAALTGAASAAIGNFIGPYIAKIVGKFGNYVVELVKSGKISAKRLSASQKSSIKCLIKESCCFVEGTLVLTESGRIPIEQIEIGDFVYATNTETGEISLKKVTQTFLRETNELVHIYINDRQITTTPEHPFWVVKKGWVVAGQLQSGDKLLSADGTEVSVSKIGYEFLIDSVQVYNFEVEGFHTYYVGTEEILVHNTCVKDFVKSPKKFREVEKFLKKAGFEKVRQEGSHVIFKDLVTGKTVPVPNHGSKEIPIGTLRNIFKTVGLL